MPAWASECLASVAKAIGCEAKNIATCAAMHRERIRKANESNY
jgi:hypothetical protein